MGKRRRVFGLAWPVVALAASYISLAIFAAGLDGDQPLWASLIVLALLICCALFMGWTLVSVFRVLGMLRRRFGIYTKSEQRAFETQRIFADGWKRGVELLAFLSSGGHPRTYTAWDVVLNPDEVMYLDTQMQYSRFYGTDASYVHTSTVAVGRASFVVGAALGNAVGNARARNAAMVAAQPMWREHQYTRTLVTSQRIMCRTGGGWLSFYMGAVTACHATPGTWSLALEFSDTETLRLHGPDAPSVCVMVLGALYGNRSLAGHPALADLNMS
ncbi:hypothetical protein LFT48_16460 [Arthrobacter sp. FW305-123]|nr:hypothetical protein LFT48_16460 [Arthrobacter sp. FW305-123]